MSAAPELGHNQAGLQQLRPVSELRPHPYDALVPAIPADDYAALREDIQRLGVQDPLHVSGAGVVLDGRARLRAALELGLSAVPVLVVEPDNEEAHMLRQALRRRHLDPSQKAAIALRLLPLDELREQATAVQRANLRQGNTDGSEVATLPARGERIRELVAQVAGTSPRTAQDAITVFEHDPAGFERMLRGEISANRAASKVRRAQRDASIPPPPPLPSGRFPLILADPPWPSGSPDSGSAPEQHYPTTSITGLKALDLPTAEDCVLFLWTVDWAFQGAIELLDAWGFRHKSSLVWIKQSTGTGVWVRHRHESCWIAIKGNPSPPEPEDRCDSVIEAPRRRHSQKPDELYRRIEQMYPHLPKLELFARGAPRPGWQSWGNEAERSDGNDAEGEPGNE